MSYAHYQFTGVIIRIQNISDAHRLLWLASSDRGILVIKAMGIRYEKSKLRYVAQLGSVVTAEVISGKSGWKLTGLESVHNPRLLDGITKYISEFSEIAQTMVQVSGEEVTDELVNMYQILERAMMLMGQYEQKFVVMCARAEILSALGYLDRIDYLDEVILDRITTDSQYRTELQQKIDRALYASHMTREFETV